MNKGGGDMLRSGRAEIINCILSAGGAFHHDYLHPMNILPNWHNQPFLHSKTDTAVNSALDPGLAQNLAIALGMHHLELLQILYLLPT